MRAYRRSPLYPRVGQTFAAGMAPVMRIRKSPVVRTVNGVRYALDLNEVIDSSLYFSGRFESGAEGAIRRLVTAGDVAIDIGSNIGYHTFGMAREVGPDGLVLAVDPSAWAMKRLNVNMSLNDFSNIRPIRVALGDSPSPTTISAVFRASYRLDGRRDDVPEEVRILSLDTLVDEQSLTRLDFIKLDVDGMEAQVLRGASQSLRRWMPNLLFEITPSALAEIDEDWTALLQSLLDLGYRFETENGAAIPDVMEHCARVPWGYSTNLLAVSS